MRRRCIYAHKKAITSAEQNSRSNYMIRMLKFDMTRPKFNPMGVCRVFDGGYVFDGTASLSLFALGVSVDFFTPSPLDPPANMTRRGCLLPQAALYLSSLLSMVYGLHATLLPAAWHQSFHTERHISTPPHSHTLSPFLNGKPSFALCTTMTTALHFGRLCHIYSFHAHTHIYI